VPYVCGLNYIKWILDNNNNNTNNTNNNNNKKKRQIIFIIYINYVTKIDIGNCLKKYLHQYSNILF